MTGGSDLEGPRWLAETAAMEGDGDDGAFQPGVPVGAYLVEERRSRGGFATVYRARRTAGGEPVALKVLHRHLAASAAVVARFLQEARTVGRIHHPHVVTIHEVGQLADARPYLVLEWLDGETLERELASRGRLPVDEAVRTLEPLCAALELVHRAGIVHRDVKAANVMRVPGPDGPVVKLLDFGIAKLLDAREPGVHTTASALLGTPQNMAPEQILREPVDGRTDVYALGILLYQLLTGRPPFVGRAAVEIEEMHLHTPPPAASDAAPVPAAMDEVIRRCLAKRPADRFPDVGELLVALRAATSGGPRTQPMTARALGLLVEARLEGSGVLGPCATRRMGCDVDDDVLVDLAGVVALARERCEESGLTIAVAASGLLLAVALLPDAEAEARTVRMRVLEQALALGERLAGRPGGSPRVSALVSLHEGRVVCRPAPGAIQLLGGDLLCVGDWPGRHPGGARVRITPTVDRGIDRQALVSPDRIVLEPPAEP